MILRPVSPLLCLSTQACVLLWRRHGGGLRLYWQWGFPELLQTQQQMHLANHCESLTVSKYWLLPQPVSQSLIHIQSASRSQREVSSHSPSAFLTWRLTHNVDTTIWMFTMAIPTWCRNLVAFVELSGRVLLFLPQTPWCWRWWLMERRRQEGLWPILVEPNPTEMVCGHILEWFLMLSCMQICSACMGLQHTTK